MNTPLTDTPVSWRFIEPLDVLFLRGNQHFGAPGSYGESMIPPWPSVAAGALRSSILVRDGVDLGAFAKGAQSHPELGTPAEPGSFVLQSFQLARQNQDGSVEQLFPLPADLVIAQRDDDGAPVAQQITPLRPAPLHAALSSSCPLPLLPILAQPERNKPASGWWLRQSGWQRYLHGQALTPTDVVHASQLWRFDERVGIGLHAATRSAEDGKLFTVRAVAMAAGVGFVTATSGAKAPEGTTLRLGGDGRGARVTRVQIQPPTPDYDALAQAGRCRIVLTSPGLFAAGWQLPGMDDNAQLTLPGLHARVVAAAVSRSETISGWDLARQCPKAAQKATSAGSVYWLENLEATPDALRKLVADGLWTNPCEDATRRAEGFNRFSFATY